MNKCNDALTDARRIRVQLFNRGQDVNETVICELLTSYDSNCRMDKTEYIFNMITNDTAPVNSDSNVERSAILEDSIKLEHFFNEIASSTAEINYDNNITDKITESNTLNSSGTYVTAETIDVSSDSSIDINFCQPTNNNDVIIENAIHALSPYSLSEPCANTSYLHQSIIPINDDQVECSKENDDDIIYLKEVIHTHKKIRYSESPQPGCSKDFDSTNTSPEWEEIHDCNGCNSCNSCYTSNERLHKEAEKIHSLLPASYSYVSVFGKLADNIFAENRTELALWDLLPMERPDVIRYKPNSSSHDRCMKFRNCHSFSKESLTDIETTLKEEDKAHANSEITADVKLENGEFTSPINRTKKNVIEEIKKEDEAYANSEIIVDIISENEQSISPINRTKRNIIEEIVEEDVSSNTGGNNTDQQSVTPVHIQEAKLHELKASNEQSMPVLKKIKLDIIDAPEDADNCNNDNDQPGTSLEKEKLSELDTSSKDVFNNTDSNNTDQQIVTPVQIQEAKLSELKASSEQSMPVLKKIKLDAPEDTNNSNNDNDQQEPSFRQEKLSELDTSSKNINFWNMHVLEKSELPEIDLKDTKLQSIKVSMLDKTKVADICDYNNSIPKPLIRAERFSFNANYMDAVAGPSTSSSFQSSILSPPKFTYLEKKLKLTKMFPPNTNIQDTRRISIREPKCYEHKHFPFSTLARNKDASDTNTALSHSSVNLAKSKDTILQPFATQLLNRRSEWLELTKRANHVKTHNMLPASRLTLKAPSFLVNNTLNSLQMNVTKGMPVLNLSQHINSSEENNNLGQKGDGADAFQVCDQENVLQTNMHFHTSAEINTSERPVERNKVEPKEIVLNEKARKLYYKIIPMFPCVNTDFIKQLCQNSVGNMQEVDEAMVLQHLVDQLLDHGPEHPYVKKEEPLVPVKSADLNEQYADLLGIFPEADPEYLRQVAEKLYNDPEEFKQFVQSKLEKPDYPTREQYLNKKKISEQVKQYTTNFQVQQFLDIFPDPFAHFEDKNRQCVFNAYAVDFLKYYFNKIRVNTMLSFYSQNGYNLSATAKALESLNPNMKNKRCGKIMPTENIPLLQEIAFIQHKAEIQDYLDKLKAEEKKEFIKLKATNQLLECQCCYDNECMPSKCSTCEDGHIFCNSCIARSTDVTLADGKTHVFCLINCGREFSLSILQRILPPTKFSILLCKRQEAEVMAAGVEGLVSCPFCHFASIPPPEDKVFKCLNPDCMKESCRLCKELNHVPLKCDEVKTDAARLYLEEKMTEALIRKCYNCGRTFFKEDGCNKMACVCGAFMCYICDKPVKGYEHFQGQGAMASNLCPLWSDDRRMNAEAVIKVCQETMKHIKEKNPNIDINVESLLPQLPPKTRGPHDDIANANAIPIHANRIARQIQ